LEQQLAEELAEELVNQVGSLVARTLDLEQHHRCSHSCLFCHSYQHRIQLCSWMTHIPLGRSHMVPGHMLHSPQVLAVVLAVVVLETWLVRSCLAQQVLAEQRLAEEMVQKAVLALKLVY